MFVLSGRLRGTLVPVRHGCRPGRHMLHGSTVGAVIYAMASSDATWVSCETEAHSARIKALAASPPKLPGVATRTAIPEFCLSVPKTHRRRRRRRGEGDGGGSGGGGDGGGYGGWDDAEWHDGDNENGRLWMWMVLLAYSVLQGLLLLTTQRERKTPTSFLAAITVSVLSSK